MIGENKNFLLSDNFDGDILQVVPTEEIPKILELLKTDWPNSLTVYNFITTHLYWKKYEPDEMFYVLSPHGDWDDATIVCISVSDIPVLTVYSLEPNSEKLKTALQQTKLINWKCKYFVCGFIHEKQYDIVLEIVKNKGVKDNDMLCNRNFSFWVPSDKAKTFPVEENKDFYFDRLKPDHAKVIDNSWPFKSEKSLNFFTKIIKYNESVGMFRKSDSVPIGWIVSSDYGLGSLHVEVPYRKKGYGKMIVNEIIRRLGEKGRDVASHVLLHNEASLKLFKSVGCDFMCYVTWIFVSQ